MSHGRRAFWMLLGTIALSVAASISANLLCDLNADRPIPTTLVVVSIVLMAAGAVFCWLYAWKEHLIHRLTEEREKRERDFGLACVDAEYNQSIFVKNYEDPTYHLGRDEVLYARVQFQRTQTITRPMLGKLEGDARRFVFRNWDQWLRRIEYLGYLLLAGAILALTWPPISSLIHHAEKEETLLPRQPAVIAPHSGPQQKSALQEGGTKHVRREAGARKPASLGSPGPDSSAFEISR